MHTPSSGILVPKPIIVSLKQVAAWDLEHLNAPFEIKASVPALQRGLVWRPQQVELLWDSILRGFPIGSLVVSQKMATQERSGKLNINRHLLDGQQRCNAITLGFHDPFDEHSAKVTGNKSESILWIDLAPQGTAEYPKCKLPPSSTRQFLTRVTTLAHPWGYQPDDNASKLSAEEARQAVEREYPNNTHSESRPSSMELYPSHANAPVPLAWLMSAVESKEDHHEFWQTVRARLEQEATRRRWPSLAINFLKQDNNVIGLGAIYLGIRRAVHTRLVIMEAPEDILSKSRQEESVENNDVGNVASIEHLFNRLNRQGTTLDGEELAYSMVKAYWPEVACVIDSVKNRRIPASQLVSLGTRAALTAPGSKKLARPLRIAQLRTIANACLPTSETSPSSHYVQRLRIEEFIGKHSAAKVSGVDARDHRRLAHACETVEEWLNYDPESSPNGLPPVLVSSFARKSSDLYLFLFHIADRLRGDRTVRDRQWKDLVPGAAMLVHWFAPPEKTLSIADTLMEAVVEEVSPESVRKGLRAAIGNGLIIKPRPPVEVEAFVQLPDDGHLPAWKWWKSLIEYGTSDEQNVRRDAWQLFLERMAWQREILLFAQRRYLCSRFRDYDPSRKDLWEDHNRPWDFDHIHASAYFYNAKRGTYADLCRQWGNCIGNLRAWPFEKNRSDQKRTAKDKFDGPPDDMEASFIESQAELDAFSHGDKTRDDSVAARALCEAIKTRLIRVYGAWYEAAGINQLLSPA